MFFRKKGSTYGVFFESYARRKKYEFMNKAKIAFF